MTVAPSYPPAPDGACLIPLSRGKFALVDEADYEAVTRYRWHFNRSYAARNLPCDDHGRHRRRTQFLHRFLIEPPDGMEVDHINGDGCDCRRANMRLATHAQNMRNLALRSDNASGHKGVSWDKRTGRWFAKITVAGKQIPLGLYATVVEAAWVYNAAASALFGSFARLNVLPDAGSGPLWLTKVGQRSAALWQDPDYREKRLAGINAPGTAVEKAYRRWQDPEYREKTLAAREDPVYRAQRSAAAIEQWEDPEYRARMSILSAARWDDPDYRAKMFAGITPEVRAARSDATRRGWNDPAIREKRLAGLSDGVRKHMASLSPEERSRRGLKGVETRRRNAEQRRAEENV